MIPSQISGISDGCSSTIEASTDFNHRYLELCSSYIWTRSEKAPGFMGYGFVRKQCMVHSSRTINTTLPFVMKAWRTKWRVWLTTVSFCMRRRPLEEVETVVNVLQVRYAIALYRHRPQHTVQHTIKRYSRYSDRAYQKYVFILQSDKSVMSDAVRSWLCLLQSPNISDESALRRDLKTR